MLSASACHGDTAHLQCPGGTYISVHQANYGRLNSEVCAAGRDVSEVGHTSCRSAGTTTAVAGHCGGKNQCAMTVDDVTLNSGADPCVGTFKYLDVQYKCTDRKGESHEHVYRNAS